jgi:predicted flap endonuclease-1-like 5' DNA nuclease
MNPWINEEILKTWTEAQKRLWDSLCSAVPFRPPTGVEAWRETYLENLATWEAAVKKTLAQEVAWVEQWVRQVAQEKGTPEMMTAWVEQMEEVLHRWIQTQTQWWDEYFAVLRRGGCVSVAASEPAPGAEPVAASEPAPGAEPVTVAETAEAVATEAPPVVVELPVPVEPPPAPVAPVAAAPAVEASLAAEPAPGPVPAQPDDLKLISGIGPALERKLHACGVRSFRELAMLGDADIDRVEATIKSFGRIRRDDWIGQARARHFEKYREQL